MSKKAKGKKWKRSSKYIATSTQKMLEEMQAFRVRNHLEKRKKRTLGK